MEEEEADSFAVPAEPVAPLSPPDSSATFGTPREKKRRLSVADTVMDQFARRAETVSYPSGKVDIGNVVPLPRNFTYPHPAIVSACQLIVQKGGLGDAFYVIVHGDCEVFDPDADPDETKRPGTKAGDTEDGKIILSAGNYFGEMALINTTPRTMSVRAYKSTLCLRIAKDDFDLVFRDAPVRSVRDKARCATHV